MSWRISLISFSSRWSANMADAYVLVFKPGPSLIGALKKDWASPSSIALSWQQPEQTTLPILEYEIKYYEKVKRVRLLSSSFFTKSRDSAFSNRNTSNWATHQHAPRLPVSSSRVWNQPPGTSSVFALARPLDTARTLPNTSMKLQETVSGDQRIHLCQSVYLLTSSFYRSIKNKGQKFAGDMVK